VQIYRQDVIHVYCLLFRRSAVIARGPVFAKGRQCNKLSTTVAGDRGRIDCLELMRLFAWRTDLFSQHQDSKKCFVHYYSCYRPVTCIRISDTNWRANYTIKNVEKWPGLWTRTTNSLRACHVTLIYVFICWSFWIQCLLASRTNIFYFVWLHGLVDVMLVLRVGCILCTFVGGACYCVMCSCFWPHCLTRRLRSRWNFRMFNPSHSVDPGTPYGQECV